MAAADSSYWSRRALLLLAFLSFCYALDNGLGLTPQMGWNSWNHYGCYGYDSETIMETVDAFFYQGLYDAGYRYVNLDDCWASWVRNSEDALTPDSNKFPANHTLQSVIDAIHDKGLLFGLYSDAGRRTCAFHDPGSLDHEETDANTWASWDVDYLKYDNCWNEREEPIERYPPMRDALNATGRPIFFSMCEWGDEDVAVWARDVGNSWRTTSDIKDTWNSMLSNLYENNEWARFAGPGGWNDPDMLEVGNGGMTNTEYVSHFSLWCLAKAPLIIGTNVVEMTNATRTILTNTEAIAVNQDPLGVQGALVANVTETASVWAGPLANGDTAVVLLNTGAQAEEVTLEFSVVGISGTAQVLVRDLWQHEDVGTFVGSYETDVESHGVAFLRLSVVSE